LTPGTSCIQPIHQSPSCLSTAVYSVFISLVYCKAAVRTSKQIRSEIQFCVSPCRDLLPYIARQDRLLRSVSVFPQIARQDELLQVTIYGFVQW
jgi:hypothetical protein